MKISSKSNRLRLSSSLSTSTGNGLDPDNHNVSICHNNVTVSKQRSRLRRYGRNTIRGFYLGWLWSSGWRAGFQCWRSTRPSSGYQSLSLPFPRAGHGPSQLNCVKKDHLVDFKLLRCDTVIYLIIVLLFAALARTHRPFYLVPERN